MSRALTTADRAATGRHAAPGRAPLRNLLHTARHRRQHPESLSEYAARVAGGLAAENLPVLVQDRDGKALAYGSRTDTRMLPVVTTERTDTRLIAAVPAPRTDTEQLPRIIATTSAVL